MPSNNSPDTPTAAYQHMAEHPDLGLDSVARADLPSLEACKANHLCVRIHDLRAAIKDYRQLVLNPEPGDDYLHF